MLSIEEITVIPKDLKIEIVQSRDQINNVDVVEKNGILHTIFRVTLQNRECYALDLTGAQYGYRQECLSWQRYTENRVSKIIAVQPFGATKEWLAAHTLKKGYPNDKVQSLSIDFMNELQRSLQLWTSREGGIGALLVSPEQEYQEKRASMLKFVQLVMELKRDMTVGEAISSQRWQELDSLVNPQIKPVRSLS